jgi:regulator of sirC expression with transglutaminase-like and TPR domain
MEDGMEDFRSELAKEDVRVDLARACLMVAQDAYPALDIHDYLSQLDALGIRLKARLKNQTIEERVLALNDFLYDKLGYWGNTDDYYDPRNSYLNEVMDRKTGIPITMAVVYMEVGRRIGLPLEGVSFPGHFLVRLKLRGGTLILDPFTGGAPQSEADLRERLKRVIPEGAVPTEVGVGELPLDQFLEPASNRQILARLLRNLKGIYRETDQPERLLSVLNRMLVVSPDAPAELRDRGFVYQKLECWRPALQDLTGYLERDPEAADMDEVRAALMELASRCARLN